MVTLVPANRATSDVGTPAQAKNLASHSPFWRQTRIRAVVAGRHIGLEIGVPLAKAPAARGLALEDVCSDPPASRRFTDSMPSSDVCISLTAAAHRNPQTRWTRNRIFDTWALSVAVPNCDVVATDREASHALQTEGAPERLGTSVVSSLNAVVDAMGRWCELREIAVGLGT